MQVEPRSQTLPEASAFYLGKNSSLIFQAANFATISKMLWQWLLALTYPLLLLTSILQYAISFLRIFGWIIIIHYLTCLQFVLLSLCFPFPGYLTLLSFFRWSESSMLWLCWVCCILSFDRKIPRQTYLSGQVPGSSFAGWLWIRDLAA
jgi:hypothetical protein